MVYKEHKCGSYNIHTIKVDKFKNIRMEIIFRNNINPETVARRTFLFDVLVECSLNYPTKREKKLKLESLYNASLESITDRVGNQVLSSIIVDFLDPKFTEDDYLEEAISMPFDMIFNPLVKNLEFNNKVIETIKARTISDILAIKETPSKYFKKSLLEKALLSSVSQVSIIGTESEINNITSSNLYEIYQEVLNHDYIDIYIIGDIDENRIVDLISKYAKFNTIKNHELNLYVDNKVKNKPTILSDKSTYKQSHIGYLYNTTNLTDFENKYVSLIYNTILGGPSLESKLYKNLRNKNSLCYTVHSIRFRYDGLILIYTSVDNANINKARKLIDSTVNEMTKNITEEELSIAKSTVVSSINADLDSPSRIIDQYLFHDIANSDLFEERIKNFQSVTLKDLKKLNNKIRLNTIYVLEGKDDE